MIDGVLRVAVKKLVINMNLWDRAARIVLGIILLVLAVLSGLVHDAFLRGFIFLFGIINVVSGLISYCPIYHLAKVSTANKIKQDG